MHRFFLVAGIALALASTAGAAGAATKPCRDAHGKFIKCPAPPPPPVRCRDAHGKFVKCGTAGAHPA